MSTTIAPTMATMVEPVSAMSTTYTSAASSTAIRIPIMCARFPVRSFGNLLPRLAGQQRVTLVDRPGHVDHGAVVAPGVVAQEHEGGSVVDVMALHQDPLGPLDEGPPLEGGLELVDALAERRRVGVATHGELDRCPHVVFVHRLRERRDAAGRGLGHELRIGLVEHGDHGAT